MSSLSSGIQLESGLEDAPAWKQEVNSRLAAHRTRRGTRGELQTTLPGMESAAHSAPSRGRSIADRVAARYAQAPTYSEMLAAEAQNAARAAEAAAKAANEAHAAAQAILIGLDVHPEDVQMEEVHVETQNTQSAEPATPSPPSQPQYRAEMPAQLAARRHNPFAETHSYITVSEARSHSLETFQTDPFEEALVTPVQPLPANLIEFPRELIAARKARPRLAEGPLREGDDSAGEPQLRIFEVEPESISTAPQVDPVLPEWSSIRLDARPEHPSSDPVPVPPRKNRAAAPAKAQSFSTLDLPLQTAPLEDRMMSAIVDLALVVAGFLVFVLVFAACTAHPPTGKPALIGAGVVLFIFFLIYQFLFFKYGQDTPGMRYAKIALCTFDDENPSRQAALRRIGALLLSAAPMGLGLLWAIFDDDRLGWHDRISRTYQRSYR